ncbi:RNA-binding protein 7 [Engraulis encrasicolus]|uniref:RNA-binding protein 7 n=1 Tax=Engraulis encrasicolus TaxID=184585 RepID=UPI002FD0D612
MGTSLEADRTLFVGNLDPQVTEELLFELFLQAGPLTTVKIPKDNDGRPKQFAFINFKHEVSAPYGMSLLNGTKMFGRPLKIQFRSGSSHANQEGKGSPQMSPSHTPGRFDGMGSPMFNTPPQQMQRSFSSPDSLQRQALMNNMFQMQMQQIQQLNGALSMGFPPPFAAGAPGTGGGPPGGGGNGAPGLLGSPWLQQENQSQAPRGHRGHSQDQESRGGGGGGGAGGGHYGHSHDQESRGGGGGGYGHSHDQESRGGGGGGGHYGRDQRYNDGGPDRHRREHGQRGNDFYHHDDRSGGGGSGGGGRVRDYPPDRRRDSRDGSRDGRYRRY